MSSGFGPAPGAPQEAPEPLQFERVEPGEPGGPRGAAAVPSVVADPRCQLCGHRLEGTYFEIDSQLACVSCRDQFVEQERSGLGGSGAGRFLKALAAGCGAGVVGAILYYAIRAATGYDLGLIAIVVGILVGKAVRWGSAGRGGRSYQVLAMLLTYLALGGTYLPAALEGMAKKEAKTAPAPASAPAPAGPAAAVPKPVLTATIPLSPRSGLVSKPAEAKVTVPLSPVGFILGLGATLLLIAALPIVVAAASPILIVIFAIGLYEAWKMSRPLPPRVAGPFALGTQRPLPPPG